jgi:hypothetical protein
MNNKIYSLLNKSKISLLGYSFNDENIKDEFLSKIPHIKVSDINSSFNLKSIIRENKLDSIISDGKLEIPKFIVIDTQDIRDYVIKNSIKRDNFIDITTDLSKLIQEIGFEFYESKYNLIFTAPIQRSPEEYPLFLGGHKLMYFSHFVFKIENDKINILKNRYSEEKEINIKDLKEYNFYEHIK